MFRITIPVESRRHFLVSLFQSNVLEYAESMCFNAAGWSPFRYFRHIFRELEALADGVRNKELLASWMYDCDTVLNRIVEADSDSDWELVD